MPNPKEEERFMFAQFLVMNDEQKMKKYGYKDQNDFAAEYKIAPKTLTEWKRHDKKFMKMKEELQKEKWDDRLNNVVDVNYKVAMTGDVAGIREYYKLLGVTSDKVQTTSSQDIQKILMDVVDMIRRHVKDKTALNALSAELVEYAKELE